MAYHLRLSMLLKRRGKGDVRKTKRLTTVPSSSEHMAGYMSLVAIEKNDLKNEKNR